MLARHVLEEAVIVQLLGPDDGLVDSLDVPARLVAGKRRERAAISQSVQYELRSSGSLQPVDQCVTGERVGL